MSPNHLLARAIAIAAKAFKDKMDKSGEPYILHCMRVMNKQTTITRKIIAILHDLVEDTSWDFDELKQRGFSADIIIPLMLLTHDQVSKNYDNYIKDISNNDDARAVKMADLEDNLQITRLKTLNRVDHARLDKYCKAYQYLLQS